LLHNIISMDKGKIKIFLISGFLGAGKTTFLNLLLEQYSGEKNFVIENEYGKESIDADLVRKNYNQLFEMNNGCLCCALDQELIAVLEELISLKEIPDNLFIEASGIADTGILSSIFRRDDILKFFELKKIITLVDAENIEDRFDEVLEAGRQVCAAELLIINKIDLVKKGFADELTKKLGLMNPFAKITSAINAEIDFSLVEEASPDNFPYRIDQKFAHTSNMKSILMEFDVPFDLQKLYSALTVSLFLHYHQIFRIKGFLSLKDLEGRYLLQSTGKKISVSPHGQWQEVEEAQSKIVVIGKDIERKSLERIFKNAF